MEKPNQMVQMDILGSFLPSKLCSKELFYQL